MGGARCRSSSGRKKRDIRRQKALYRCPRYHRERARFFATVNGKELGGRGRGERRGGRTDDDDIRFCAYTHCRRLDRLPPSPPHPSSPLFCLCPSSRPPPPPPSPPPFLFLFLRSIPLDSFLTLAMGRPIATSADSALLRLPTYLFPIYLVVRGQGEPDLSPLNGINKLYYACTSP